MNVLVTGGSGFVGLNLLEQMLEAGHRVVSFSVRSCPASAREHFQTLSGQLVEIEGDVRDRAALRRAMDDNGVERVLHGAAITANAARERRAPEDVISVNLAGLAALVTAAAEARVRRVVLVSSVGVYGTSPADSAVLDEERPHTPATLYGITKSAGEAIFERLASLHGLDHALGRLGVVFGPYEYDTGLRDTLSPILVCTRRAFRGEAIALPRPALKNWHYVRDAAASLVTLLLAETLNHRVYNLGPPDVWSLADWCQKLVAHCPDSSVTVGGGRGEDVGLWNPRDGGLLSGGRFAAEFGPVSRFGLDAAFSDYMRFLQTFGSSEFGLSNALANTSSGSA